MLRPTSMTLALLLAVAAPAATQQKEQKEREAPAMTVKTIPLHHLAPKDAATLVSPYVQPYGGVYEAGGPIRAITVRGEAKVLTLVESLLREHDRAPASLVLRFQLIAADNSPARDPAIAGVDSVLRSLFRFPGYRLLAQTAATTVVDEHFHQLISTGDDRLSLDGVVLGVNTVDGQQVVRLRVGLSRPESNTAQGRIPGQGLLGTVVAIPVGQTVVVGSAAPGGTIQALILAVRPEIVPPKR